MGSVARHILPFSCFYHGPFGKAEGPLLVDADQSGYICGVMIGQKHYRCSETGLQYKPTAVQDDPWKLTKYELIALTKKHYGSLRQVAKYH
jgi:hypothetical protein